MSFMELKILLKISKNIFTKEYDDVIPFCFEEND